MVFYYVYILQSKLYDQLYIGYIKDLKKRLFEHNNGLNSSTKPYIPWQIIHYEAYRDLEDVKRREAYLKTNQGSRLMKRMLKEFFYKQKVDRNAVPGSENSTVPPKAEQK